MGNRRWTKIKSLRTPWYQDRAQWAHHEGISKQNSCLLKILLMVYTYCSISTFSRSIMKCLGPMILHQSWLMKDDICARWPFKHIEITTWWIIAIEIMKRIIRTAIIATLLRCLSPPVVHGSCDPKDSQDDCTLTVSPQHRYVHTKGAAHQSCFHTLGTSICVYQVYII